MDVLLRLIPWTFEGEIYADRATFAKALEANVRDPLYRVPPCDLEEIVIPHEVIIVISYCGSPPIRIMAPSARGLSTTEILFQLHNAMLPFTRGRDHRYFEGLSHAGVTDGVPVYEMSLGS